MLARGGNAVDAALATAITLTVVEPTQQRHRLAICSRSSGTARELVGLNASGRAPAALAPARFAAHARDARRAAGTRSRFPVPSPGWRCAVAALRRAAVRRPVRARDPLRARRLRGRRRSIARAIWQRAAPHACRTTSASVRAFPAARTRTAAGRALRERGDGAHARERSRESRRRTRSTAASSRTAMVDHASRNGGVAHARRFRGAHGGLGHAARAALPRRARARDPAQRTGHRRADGARHAARTSTCARCRPTRSTASTSASRR